jgi:predicted transcriptional regulator
MSVRRLRIGIRSASDRSKSLRETMRRVALGERTQQEPVLYFENIDELRQVLTEKRLELLTEIVRHRPASVHQLAVLAGRDYKNVATDVALLERLGLISLRTQTGKGRAQAPSVPYDKIQLTVDLRQPGADKERA